MATAPDSPRSSCAGLTPSRQGMALSICLSAPKSWRSHRRRPGSALVGKRIRNPNRLPLLPDHNAMETHTISSPLNLNRRRRLALFLRLLALLVAIAIGVWGLLHNPALSEWRLSRMSLENLQQ